MASGSRSYNFGSDDVLCSYDDFAAQDSSSTKRSEPSAQDLPRPLVNIYEQEDRPPKEDLVSTVERCMKKYADTLMRSLDGITGRLSQLEIHCYKLERSIGELRGDMVQGQNEADLKFKSLEKHMQEVHRAVQILRDKQELAEAQKELAKLQTIQKESAPKPEERAPTPLPESAKHEDPPQLSNNQLALVPSRPQAVQQQQQLAQLPMQQDQYTVNQPTTYYSSGNQAPTQQLPPGYQWAPQPQVSVQVPPPQQPQVPVQPAPQQQQQPAPPPQVSQVVNPVSQQQQAPFPPYPHQWAPQPQPNPNPNPQQFAPQGMQPSQAVTASQAAPQRPHTPPGYSPYPPHQPSNPIPETYPVSMPIPTHYSAAPQPGMNRSDMVPVGYASQGNARPPQPHPNQGSFVASPQMVKIGYTNITPYPMQGNVPGYSSGPYNYPPSSNVSGINMGSQQLPRNHPYGEFIEKAVSMGYPREQVTSVAMKMAESGQPMDLNALLDRLNGVSSPSPRAWSG